MRALSNSNYDDMVGLDDREVDIDVIDDGEHQLSFNGATLSDSGKLCFFEVYNQIEEIKVDLDQDDDDLEAEIQNDQMDANEDIRV